MRATLPPELVVGTTLREQQKHAADQKNRQSAGHLNYPANDYAVFSGRRIIMKAVPKHGIGERPDLIVSGLDQREA